MSEKRTNNEQNPDENTNGFVDQEWPPFKGSMGEEMSEEDRKRFEEWQQKAESDERDDFEGESNETVKMDHGKAVLDEDGNPVMRKRAVEGNPFDYTPRVAGETNADYGARLRWMKLMAEKIESDPMTDEDIRYKENGERDREASEAAWRERVGVPSLAEYVNGDDMESSDIDGAGAGDGVASGAETGVEDGATEDDTEARKAAEQSLVDALNEVLKKKAEENGQEEEQLKPFDIKDIENPTSDDLAYEAWLKSNAMTEEEPAEAGPDKPFDTRDVENPTQDDLSYEAWLRSNANPDNLDMDGNPINVDSPDKPFDINDIENPTDDDKAYDAWLKSNANPNAISEDGQPNLGSEVRPNGEEEDGKEYDPTKSRWSQMTEEEKEALLRKYPRNEGEDTNSWGKRIEASEGHRIFGVEEGATPAEEDPSKKEDSEKKEDEEDEETRKKRLMRELSAGAIADWIQNVKGLTRGDLDKLSADELQALIDEFEKSEGKEDNEALKKRLMRELSAGDIADWVQKEKGLTRGDLDKMSTDELQALIDEYNKRGKGAIAGGGKPEKPGDDGTEEKEPKTKEKLIATTIDLQKDAKDAARLIAQNMLNETLSKGGKIGRFVKGVVWGQLFREGVLQRYQKQAYEMIQAKQRGESTELGDNDWSGSKAGIERFVAAYVNGMQEEMIATDAGEQMDVFGLEKDDDGTEHAYRYGRDKDGNQTKERLSDDSVEAEATKSMHDAIAQYAQGKLSKEQFENQMRLIQKSLNDEGANTDLMIDNFMNVAEAARDRYDHEESIDSIMDGFTFINGEARRNVRTEAHRDALDRITEKLSNSRIGRILPPEVIGTAASLATNLGKSGLRTALVSAGTIAVGATMAPAVVPVAVGMVTTGVLASIRERNRSTTDRETQARRMAQGEEAGDTGYDERMERTQYEARSAKAYTEDLSKALESGDAAAIEKALATAEAATRLSDRGKIDLIRYSSGDTDVIEQERMDLAVQRAKAKAELKKQGVEFDSEVMTKAIESATDTFEKDISAKDAAFRKLRRRRMAGQGVKSAIVAGVASVAAQEVVAAFNPNQYGIFDKVFGLKNNDNANATLLSGALGFNKKVIAVNTEARMGVKNSEMTPERKAELEQMGYTVKSRTETTLTDQEVSGAEYFKARGNSSCENWLNNGTSGSDGTELQGYYRAGEGPFTVARGVASGGGESYDLSQMGDQIKFYMRPTPDSAPIAINGTFNSAGEIVPDTTGLDSAVADMLRDRAFYQIQGGIPTGVENGVEQFSSIWTYGGSSTLPETVTTQVETSTTLWDIFGFNKTTDMAVSSFPTFGAARRKNLTRGKVGSGDATVHVPTGARVPVDNPPSGGGEGGATPRGGGETPPSGGAGGGETPPADDGEEIIDIYTTPPAYAVEAARKAMEEEGKNGTPETATVETPKAEAPKAETPTAETSTAEAPKAPSKEVRPGDMELPGVPTEKYEQIDADSYSTLVEIDDGDLQKLIPSDRLSAARGAIDHWNSLPVEMRRRYLSAESDDAAGMDADSLDVAKSMEAFGLIRSEHNDGKLAEGVTRAPEHGAHADALDEIDSDAIWMGGAYPNFKETIGLYTDGDTRIAISDDEIRKQAHNPIMGESEIAEIRSALLKWNTAKEEEQRKILANSRYRSSSISEKDLALLENINLIKRESHKMTFKIKDGEGRAITVGPAFERSVNNVRAFKPKSGRAA